MIWTRPGALVFLLFPLALFALHLARFRRKNQIFRTLGDPSVLGRLTDPAAERHQRVKAAFALLAAALLAAALAGPRWGRKFQEVHRRGSDVIVAVDVSLSMMAEDVKPNRLDRAKAELGLLIDELEGDRVGLVAFAGDAFLQCPLTLDYGAAKTLLDLIAPDLIPQPGTSLAAAIDTALQALPPGGGDSALVLLTDGEDHSGRLDEAMTRARAAGLRIFAIGLGSPQGEAIPLRDENGELIGYKKDKKGQVVTSKLGEADLRRLAAATGGGYYRSESGDIAVDRIVADLRGLKKKNLESRVYGQYEDRTAWPATLVLLLLLLEFLWPERPGRWREIVFRRGAKERGHPQRSGALVWTFAVLCWASAEARAAGRRPSAPPRTPPAAYNEGHRLYEAGDYAGAARVFDQAQAQWTDAAMKERAAYNAGNALFRAGKLDEAVEKYKQALRLDPSDMDAKYNLEMARKQKPDKKKSGDDKKNGPSGGSDDQNPTPAGATPAEAPPRPGALSREDAERLLEAAAQEERNQRRQPPKSPPPSDEENEDW